MNVIDVLRAATKSHKVDDDDRAIVLRKELQRARHALQQATKDERDAAGKRYEEARQAYDARVAELDELREQAVVRAMGSYGAAFNNAKAAGVPPPQRGRGIVKPLRKLAPGKAQVTCTGVQHIEACPCLGCRRRRKSSGSAVRGDDEELEDVRARVAALSSPAEAQGRKRSGDERPRGTLADGQNKTPVGGQDDERRAQSRQKNGATGVDIGTVEMGEAEPEPRRGRLSYDA